MNVEAEATMTLVSAHLPADLRKDLLLVGSLAAAYHYRQELGGAVRTKDADIVIQPAGNLSSCARVADELLRLGWRPTEQCHGSGPDVPTEDLRAVRLYPPTTTAYFVELLGLPSKGQLEPKRWESIEVKGLRYGVPAFRFMGLLAHAQCHSTEGVAYAHPAMMALANALSHPKLTPDLMGEPIGGRSIRRCAKDLGRVLAIAWLTEARELGGWPALWEAAGREQFGEDWHDISVDCASGIEALLEDGEVLEQAHHTVVTGLLQGKNVREQDLRAVGERLLHFALRPLQRLARGE